MNKSIHALIVAVFAIACLFLSWMLALIAQLMPRMPLPGFTQFCVSLKPVLYVLPILAVAYCCRVWFSKEATRRSWVGFFAGTMMALVLVMVPTIIATWLPMLAVVTRLTTTSP